MRVEWRIGEGTKFEVCRLFGSECERKHSPPGIDVLVVRIKTENRKTTGWMDSPTRVKKSSTTMEGPMSGKIRENVEAKMMASTHAPVARVGSYDLGYAADIALKSQLIIL